jgi:hypothetical protein
MFILAEKKEKLVLELEQKKFISVEDRMLPMNIRILRYLPHLIDETAIDLVPMKVAAANLSKSTFFLFVNIFCRIV